MKKPRFRYNVRSFCFHKGKILTERLKTYSVTIYYFPGGELELGESFEECLKREYQEEFIDSKITSLQYLFTVENYFTFIDQDTHSLEHYFLVEIDNYNVKTKEPQFLHSWVDLNSLDKIDIRPEIVKNALIDGSWKSIKHLSNMNSN